MPTNRKLLGAAAFSLALTGGGVAGALLGTPSLSGAQDGTDETTETTAADGTGRLGAHRGEGLAAAAEAIGISEDELRAALEDGQSIAQVAEAEGVEVQAVIDALVAHGTERLEAAIANLPDRMSELVERERLPDRGRGPGGMHGGGRGPGLEAAAEAIGISEDELRAALADGTSLAEVAADHGVDVETLVDALVAQASTRLDDAVADGRLTESEAAERSAELEERITAHVNGEHPAPGPEAEAGADAA
jgi:lambda repressor-like predicted transcriptional regulator